jgi:hypothetical protein
MLTKQEYEAVQDRAFGLLDYIAENGKLPSFGGLCNNLTYARDTETRLATKVAEGYEVVVCLLTYEEYWKRLGPDGEANDDRINFLLFLTVLSWEDFDTYFNIKHPDYT